ncbi:hypothetical protein [Streptomyces sp. NPDC006285]|uniref:hypothetical protein n=1 Tax=Streptomyces sp. NPDC006285 TaxID=3364742 RepID=UPI0036B58861
MSVGIEGTLTELVWSTPGRSAALEDVQCTVGEGPLFDAHRHRTLIAVPDLGQADPHGWPAFWPVAQQLGVRALFCFPLQLGAVCLSVLTAQSATPGPLTPGQLNDALLVADAVTAALIRNTSRRSDFAQAEPHTALHRAAVHQALTVCPPGPRLRLYGGWLRCCPGHRS